MGRKPQNKILISCYALLLCATGVTGVPNASAKSMMPNITDSFSFSFDFQEYLEILEELEEAEFLEQITMEADDEAEEGGMLDSGGEDDHHNKTVEEYILLDEDSDENDDETTELTSAPPSSNSSTAAPTSFSTSAESSAVDPASVDSSTTSPSTSHYTAPSPVPSAMPSAMPSTAPSAAIAAAEVTFGSPSSSPVQPPSAMPITLHEAYAQQINEVLNGGEGTKDATDADADGTSKDNDDEDEDEDNEDEDDDNEADDTQSTDGPAKIQDEATTADVEAELADIASRFEVIDVLTMRAPLSFCGTPCGVFDSDPSSLVYTRGAFSSPGEHAVALALSSLVRGVAVGTPHADPTYIAFSAFRESQSGPESELEAGTELDSEAESASEPRSVGRGRGRQAKKSSEDGPGGGTCDVQFKIEAQVALPTVGIVPLESDTEAEIIDLMSEAESEKRAGGSKGASGGDGGGGSGGRALRGGDGDDDNDDVDDDDDADVNNSTLIGGARDEFGCLSSAGYVWCAARGACLRPWETITADDDCFDGERFGGAFDQSEEALIRSYYSYSYSGDGNDGNNNNNNNNNDNDNDKDDGENGAYDSYDAAGFPIALEEEEEATAVASPMTGAEQFVASQGPRLSLEDEEVAAFAAGMEGDLNAAVQSGGLQLALAELGLVVATVGCGQAGHTGGYSGGGGSGTSGGGGGGDDDDNDDDNNNADNSSSVNDGGADDMITAAAAFVSPAVAIVANFSVHAVIVPLDVGLSVEFQRCKTLMGTGGMGDLDAACRKEGMGVLIMVLLCTLFYFYCCLRVLAYCRCHSARGSRVTSLPKHHPNSWLNDHDSDGLDSEYGSGGSGGGKSGGREQSRNDDDDDDDIGSDDDEAYV